MIFMVHEVLGKRTLQQNVGKGRLYRGKNFATKCREGQAVSGKKTSRQIVGKWNGASWKW